MVMGSYVGHTLRSWWPAKVGTKRWCWSWCNHGADPNTRTQFETALGLAAAHDNLPICLLLVARAADLYAVNPVLGGGQNALQAYGCRSNLTPAVEKKRRAVLKHACDEGPHPNAFNFLGQSITLSTSLQLAGLAARTS